MPISPVCDQYRNQEYNFAKNHELSIIKVCFVLRTDLHLIARLDTGHTDFGSVYGNSIKSLVHNRHGSYRLARTRSITPRRTRSVMDDSPVSVRLLHCSRLQLKNDMVPNRRGHRG